MDLQSVYQLLLICLLCFLGSFGHFQASQSGVHKGGLDQPLVKAGFVATRISVRSVTWNFRIMIYIFCTDQENDHMHMHPSELIFTLTGYDSQS